MLLRFASAVLLLLLPTIASAQEYYVAPSCIAPETKEQVINILKEQMKIEGDLKLSTIRIVLRGDSGGQWIFDAKLKGANKLPPLTGDAAFLMQQTMPYLEMYGVDTSDIAAEAERGTIRYSSEMTADGEEHYVAVEVLP